MKLLHDDRLLWFVNRGTGVVLLVLLTASVMFGVLATVRTTSNRWPRFVTQALHRNIAARACRLVFSMLDTFPAEVTAHQHNACLFT